MKTKITLWDYLQLKKKVPIGKQTPSRGVAFKLCSYSGILTLLFLLPFLFSCEGEDSIYDENQVEQVAPNAISDLSATAVSSDEIDLSWTDNSNNEEGFVVRQSIAGAAGEFNTIDTLGPDATCYQVTGLSPSTTYYFKIRAYNNAGYIASDEVSATTLSEINSLPILELVNNTSYPIVSFSIDNVEEFDNRSEVILPGKSYLKDIRKGYHDIRVANGFYDGSAKREIYTSTFDYTQSPGTCTQTINDPTINQILTGFKKSGIWKGKFSDRNSINHDVYFVFFANGSWQFYLDNKNISDGKYNLVSRQPRDYSLVFKVSNDLLDENGTLFEIPGKFHMNNVPGNLTAIEYTYKY